MKHLLMRNRFVRPQPYHRWRRSLASLLLCMALGLPACAGTIQHDAEQELDPAMGFLFLVYLNQTAGTGATTTCNTAQFPTTTSGLNTTIATAIETRATIAQETLCYYLFESSPAGNLTFKLSPIFGNPDLAVGKENDFGGGAPDLGTAFSCLADGWDECSTLTGTSIDTLTMTGTAGAYRFIGVYGLSCPGGPCEFGLTITED